MADRRPRQREEIAYRVIEGSAALVVPENSTLCRLNPVATSIWEQCDGTKTTAEIAARLCAEFEVSHAIALIDTEMMVGELARRRLIHADGAVEPAELVSDAGQADDAAPETAAQLSQLAHEKCIPLEVTLELTLRCNLACAHCYNFDRDVPYNHEQAADELTMAELRDIIDQLADASCLYLWFTGGETLLRPQLSSLIRYARSRRFSVGVKTNGSVLTPSRVRMLAETGVRELHVSLYGAIPETHDEFTRTAGSFDKTLKGIKLARQTGMPVKINVSVTQANAGEVTGIVEMAEAMGCTYGINPFISTRYDGTESSRGHQAEQETLKSLYRGTLRKYLTEPNSRSTAALQCGCARGTCGITATGIVYPCIGAPIPSGNLRKQRFRDIWERSPEFRRIRSLGVDDYTDCKACPDRPYCGRNSGFVYANTGNYTGAEEFTCMDAAVRREVFTGSPSPRSPAARPAPAAKVAGKIA